MPRKAAGARLYARPDTGVFYIRDTGCRDRSTGTRDRRDAERALAAYIAGKGVVSGTRHPDGFPVSEALDIYGREHAVGRAAPERIGYAIDALLPFWGGLNLSDVKAETCRRYCKSRRRILKDGTVLPISDGTLRRELNVLQAAVNYCHREGHLTSAVRVTLPEKPPARDRWLTRNEVARLIRSARRTSKGRHLARFILLSIYTGTRKEAVLGLGFMRNTTGGWIDVERGLMYRRGTEERETKKRRMGISGNDARTSGAERPSEGRGHRFESCRVRHNLAIDSHLRNPASHPETSGPSQIARRSFVKMIGKPSSGSRSSISGTVKKA